MALNQGESSSYGYTGSQNTASSINQSNNWSMSDSWTQSGTDAQTAREWSAMQADKAWERDMMAMLMQMDYNTLEAQKQRDWQTKMANTIYTRSVKNMREAGINPILAYNMGLSGAGVGSGATASLGGVPSAPMGQSFMDSWSAGQSSSRASGEAYGMSEAQGSSWGENWSNSENGLVTALNALSGMVSGIFGMENSGNTVENTGNIIEEIAKNTKTPYQANHDLLKSIADAAKGLKEKYLEPKDNKKEQKQRPIGKN